LYKQTNISRTISMTAVLGRYGQWFHLQLIRNSQLKTIAISCDLRLTSTLVTLVIIFWLTL